MILADDLRKAVLQAALQGKLTQQLADDSNVDELLKQIKKEKELLIERKNARRDKDFGEIEDTEIEFDIPASWRWIRVGDIGVYKKGPFGSSLTKSMFVPKGLNAVKVYEQKNAIQKDASLGEYYITREYYDEKMSGFQVESGDIIVSCAGTIGETYVMPENIELGIINQALMKMNIAESINIDYFLYYFDHILKTNAKKSSNGSAIKNIPPFDVFKRMLFPVPPVEEQQRIVKKLDSILAEIDEYASTELELNELQSALPYEMRKSIIQYAIQGKLIPQNLADEPASSLLERIRIERSKILKTKEFCAPKGGDSIIYRTSDGSYYEKRGKCEPVCIDEEIPFDIPENWIWARLGAVVLNRQQQKPTTDFCYIDIGSIDNANQRLNTTETIIKSKDAPSRARKPVKRGDVIYATVRPYLHNMCIIDRDFSCKPIASTGFATMVCLEGIYNKYLLNLLLSPYFDTYANDYENSKGVAYPAINDARLYTALLPIPPLAEQKRIVDKLDKILPHITDIKDAL